jgi:protein DJ-1
MLRTMHPKKDSRVLVVLTQGAEEMEAVIVIDVLRRAGIDVTVGGLDGPGPVKCSRGVMITPDVALAAAKGPFDLIVLPGGGEGSERLAKSQALGHLLRQQEKEQRMIAAICAAPSALAAHGIGKGKAMTCYPGFEGKLAGHARHQDAVVVDDGQIVTSRGPGTAFDFALALVEKLCGKEKAKSTRDPLVLAR